MMAGESGFAGLPHTWSLAKKKPLSPLIRGGCKVVVALRLAAGGESTGAASLCIRVSGLSPLDPVLLVLSPPVWKAAQGKCPFS